MLFVVPHPPGMLEVYWCAIIQSTWFIKLFVYFDGATSGTFNFAFAISHEEFLESQDCKNKCKNSAIHIPQKIILCHQLIPMSWVDNCFSCLKGKTFGKVMQSWTLNESPPLLARVEVTLQTKWEQIKLTFHILTFFFFPGCKTERTT